MTESSREMSGSESNSLLGRKRVKSRKEGKRRNEAQMEKAVVEARNRVIEKKEELEQLNGEIQVDKELAEFFKKGRLRYSKESKQNLCDRALEMMEDHKNEMNRYCKLAIDACMEMEKSMNELVQKLAEASTPSQEVNEEVTAQGSENSLASRNEQNSENEMQNVILQELRRMGREMAEIREKVEMKDTEQAIRQSLQEANQNTVRRIDEGRSPSDQQRRPVEETDRWQNQSPQTSQENGQNHYQWHENANGGGSPCSSLVVGSEALSADDRNANAMISMAMPPVGKYKGDGGLGKFEEFLESLEMKYIRVSDDKRMYGLLKSHLEGEARAIFDSFASKVVGYRSMKQKMIEKLRGDETMKEYDAKKKWEEVRVREGESVSSLCMRLERLANSAFPRWTEEHRSPMLAKKLLMQLSGWNHYRELIEVMERAHPLEKYEEVKSYAIRIETIEMRGRRLDAGVRMQPMQTPIPRHDQKHGMRQGTEYDRPLEYHSGRTGRSRQEYREPTHYNTRPYQNSHHVASVNNQNQSQRQNQQQIQKTPSGQNFGLNQEVRPVSQGMNGRGRPSDGGEGMANLPQCYKCGGRGHFARNCTSPNPVPRTNNVMREWESQNNGIMPILKKTGKEGEEEKEEGIFWRPLKRIEVDIHGIVEKAILDTGSEVTTIPEAVMRKVEATGAQVEWKKQCEDVLDAAASKLRVLGKAVVNMKVNGNEKMVGVYVVENGKDILLGQNTVEMWDDGWWSEKEEKGEPAVLAERVYLGPLMCKEVELKAPENSERRFLSSDKLNAVMKEDAYPLPRIDLTIQQLKGKKWFSTLDLIAGYWQVEMEEGSKEKTAFCTMGGLYEFNVLPFGLSTSPATFQRLMERILEKLLGDKVAVYIDDVLVATETEEEHAETLGKVFEAFQMHGLRLKAQKCKIAQEEVEYLGHLVTRTGVKMDAGKVQKIIELKAPSDTKELKRFLGMASFYRKFVHGFAEKACKLTRLTGEKVEWKWGEEEQSAFEELKNALISAPVLAQPDVKAALDGERPFVIYCDASQKAVGAVLTQEGEDGCFHPLYFASKRCTPAERNYHVTDSEALAVMFALRKFKPIYFGTKVVVRTDHMPLRALFSDRTTSARIMRWALEIQSCDVTIEYVKGKTNKVADALSRGELVTGFETSETAQEEKAEFERVVNNVSLSGTRDRWKEKTKNDAVGCEMIEKLTGVAEKMVREKGLRWSEEDGLLMVEGARGGRRFYVPESLREEVLKQFHDGKLGGHWGVSKTVKKLKEYFWPAMYQDVKEYVGKCPECTLFNVKEALVPPLKPLLVGEPFETVAIDTSLSGNRYILTVVDGFSKLGAAFPMQTKGAREVAEKFCSGWIAEGRLPRNLVSDRGGEFVNRVLSFILKILEINHILTKGYVPRENGMCERFNGTLIRLLQKKVKEKEKWDEILPFCVYTYKAAPHSTMAESSGISSVNDGRSYKSGDVRQHFNFYHHSRDDTIRNGGRGRPH